MANILEQLGFKKKTHVGISLSTNNFVELVCVDRATKSVVRYASGNVKYNSAIREIMDYDEFAEVVEGLFAEAGLNPEECSVALNLPSVHFGLTTFESNYESSFIDENIMTEIEDLYIFKRNEPAISYSILPSSSGRNQQTIAYSAMQSKVIGRLIEIFDSLQVDLVRIDNSYSSFLKALQYCDRFSKYFQREERTSVLLVTPSSCSSFYMQGNELVDYTEEPIAVKSLSTEEVYSTVSKIASSTISKNHPQSLLIISETDEVNAELVSSNLDYAGEIDTLNKSITTSDNFIEVTGAHDDIDSNMVSYLTIEAVGAAVSDFDDYPININFMPSERINPNIIEVFNGYEIDLYRFIAILLLTAIAAACLIGFAVKLIIGSQIKNNQDIAQQAEVDMGVFKRKIEDNENNNKKNVFPVLKKIIDNNTAVTNAYTQLSTEIPDNVYIKKFVSNPQGGIGILGEAKSSELVETFVTRLRAKNSDLMVSRLSTNIDDSDVPQRTNYGGLTFEIKTANTDVSLNEQENLIQQTINNIQNSTQSQTRKPSGYESGSLTPPPPVI